jgi:hypothetical protein
MAGRKNKNPRRAARVSVLVLRGLALVNIYADDLDPAKCCMPSGSGSRPTSTDPGHTDFRIGDYQDELGIIGGRYALQGDADSPEWRDRLLAR